MATMKQIADALGVSRLTVSSVVNGRTAERRISEATATRVREHLESVGFVRSRHATRLRDSASDTIGVVRTSGLYSHVAEASDRLSRLVPAATFEDVLVPEERTKWALKELIGRGVRRCVWFMTNTDYLDDAVLAELTPFLKQFQPVVAYNVNFDNERLVGGLKEAGVRLVGASRLEGFRLLGATLRRLGHRRVCLPDMQRGPLADAAASRRVRALTEAGLEAYGARPVNRPYERSSAFGRVLAKGITEAMQRHGVTAACFEDDLVAGFTMRHLVDASVRIPERLSITGYDGMEFAEAFAVPLTTLAFPVDAMVRRIERLLEKPGRGNGPRFELELVKRASLARAPGGGRRT